MALNRNYILLFLFSLVMTVSGLASMPPIDRDEPRFVQATKQMVETGDYVDIRFQDASRYQKPIGIYWLQSAAVMLSGEGAEAPIRVYRTVSALGIAIAVLVENAGWGASWAGPIASLMMEKYLTGQVKRPDLEKRMMEGDLIHNVQPEPKHP